MRSARALRLPREALADWLIAAGAFTLALSLFLTWSHQLPAAFLAQFGSSDLLRGVPRDPTAWQVYSIADVLLAALAAGLFVSALSGGRRARAVLLLATTVAVAFTLHALSRPPTNGVNLFDPARGVPDYVPVHPTSGAGEVVALIALLAALGGLLLSLARR